MQSKGHQSLFSEQEYALTLILSLRETGFSLRALGGFRRREVFTVENGYLNAWDHLAF